MRYPTHFDYNPNMFIEPLEAMLFHTGTNASYTSSSVKNYCCVKKDVTKCVYSTTNTQKPIGEVTQQYKFSLMKSPVKRSPPQMAMLLPTKKPHTILQSTIEKACPHCNKLYKHSSSLFV